VSRLRRSTVSPPLSLYALIARFLHTRISLRRSVHIKWTITSNFFSLTSSTYPTVGSDGFTCTRSHTMRHTQSVGLPWTSDRPVAEISTYTTQQTQETDIHVLGGIRPRDPSNRVRPQTYALDGGKIKVFRYKPEVALGVPGGQGSWIASTFGTMKVVRSSPLRTGRLHPQEFPWYSFLEAESTPGHMVPLVASEKIPSDTTGDRSQDLPTSSAVP
jgi:hypothetical protein